MAKSSPNYFSHSSNGRKFEIRPYRAKQVDGYFTVAGYFLAIDGQWTSSYSRPEDAAQDCASGHVSSVINAEKPYLVQTRELDFPSSIAEWEWDVVQPLEVDA